MTRKMIGFLSAVAAVAGLLALSVPAGSQEPPSNTTIEVYEKQVWDKFVDEKPLNKQSPGDTYLFKSKLMDTSTMERVGYMIGKVTMHHRADRGGSFIGDITIVFPNGKIVAYGQGKFQEFETGMTIAVTGGTGDYLGAEGSFLLKEVDVKGVDTLFTIDLLP